MARVVLRVDVIKSSRSGNVKLIRKTERNEPREDIFYNYTLECPLGSFIAGQDEAVAIEIFEDNCKVFN